ncbi:unnamed protein product [Onchocerca ochengi]|uniref:COesterase domain-containing protein n=1 Tax=Onchocerca ochengi TaxID=42157 RepID=A0A182ESX4_ONCOC|nr:unnamed protein product [Onchocerca ochengi]
MQFLYFSLLYLLHVTFGSISEGSIAMKNKSLDAKASMAIDIPPSRQTTHGGILGYYMEFNGTLAEVYEAVPYAQPPVGSLRFEVRLKF